MESIEDYISEGSIIAHKDSEGNTVYMAAKGSSLAAFLWTEAIASVKLDRDDEVGTYTVD
jgi:hypothetical protein